MRLGYCLVLFILLFPVFAAAQVFLDWSADPDGNSCTVADPGLNQPVTIYVLVRAYSDEQVTGIEFTAPVPPSSGLTHVGDTTSFATLGNSQSGIEMAFGACQTGTFLAMTMTFVRTSDAEACVPYDAQAGATYTDCFFAEHPLHVDGVALYCEGNSLPIHDISPTDGATGQPLMVSLSWKDGYYICNIPLSPMLESAALYFGTTADPPYAGGVTSPHVVGPLDANTTYYWRVLKYDWPSMGTPVMSFTTGSEVATQPSTWGAIKALYR